MIKHIRLKLLTNYYCRITGVIKFGKFMVKIKEREKEREREVLLGLTIAIAMNGWMKRVTRNLSHT